MTNIIIVRNIVLTILILASSSIASCSGGTSSTNKKYNPYIGPLADLLPKQVEQFILTETKRLDQVKSELGCIEAIQGVYRSDDKRKVLLGVYNFSSPEKALAALQELGGRVGSDKRSWQVEEKKSKEGLIGKRIASKDDVFWTNGTLLCVIDIDPQDADPTGFEKSLPF